MFSMVFFIIITAMKLSLYADYITISSLVTELDLLIFCVFLILVYFLSNLHNLISATLDEKN